MTTIAQKAWAKRPFGHVGARELLAGHACHDRTAVAVAGSAVGVRPRVAVGAFGYVDNHIARLVRRRDLEAIPGGDRRARASRPFDPQNAGPIPASAACINGNCVKNRLQWGEGCTTASTLDAYSGRAADEAGCSTILSCTSLPSGFGSGSHQ